MLTEDTFDSIYKQLAQRLTREPDFECAPRGMRVREIIAAQFKLTDPRARVLSSPTRKFNRGFAVGEFCWYYRGANDVESLTYYNKRTPQFSDDGLTLAGAYGPRLFGAADSLSPWRVVRDELLRDSDSRRAVLPIYAVSDLSRMAAGKTVDVPCTLSIQFLIRGVEKRLHAVVTMRSCDLIWGLANDVFSFTLLQEAMLLDLREAGMRVDLGDYVHQAASLHVYERHFEMAAHVASEVMMSKHKMSEIRRRHDLDLLLRDEELIRKGMSALPQTYTGGAEWLRLALDEHRRKRDLEKTETRA